MSAARLSRRALLAAIGAAGVAAAWMGGVFRGQPGSPRVLDMEEKRALAAAQDRLLPSDSSGPGARDVRALSYLEAVLRDPGVPVKHAIFIRKGVATLDVQARKRGAADFASLPARAQDQALEAFSKTPAGRWWMRTMLGYTLEAFLGDPVRGANADQRGWQWATHQPGWPRPEARGWYPTERSS